MSSIRKSVRLFVVAIAMLLMTTTAFAANPVLNKKAMTMQVGTSVKLKVSPKSKVTWTSSNKKVVTVSKSGKVKAVAPGKATIKAKVLGSKTLKCKVTVMSNSAAATNTAPANGTAASNGSNPNGKPAQGNAAGQNASSNQGNKNNQSSQNNSLIDGDEGGTISGSAGGSTAGHVMTAEEQRVYSVITAMKNVDGYREGDPFTNDDFYAWDGGIYLGGYGCAAFAMTLSDEAFGTTLARKHNNFDDIKTGDIVRLDYNTHSVIVLQNLGSELIVAEGNYNGKVHWGRRISMKEVKATGTNVMTRY